MLGYNFLKRTGILHRPQESFVLESGEMFKTLLPLVACMLQCVCEWMSPSFLSVEGHPVGEEGHLEKREVEGGNSLE